MTDLLILAVFFLGVAVAALLMAVVITREDAKFYKDLYHQTDEAWGETILQLYAAGTTLRKYEEEKYGNHVARSEGTGETEGKGTPGETQS